MISPQPQLHTQGRLRARPRSVIARGANGQPRTYRLAPASAQRAAYRRLAVAIVGVAEVLGGLGLILPGLLRIQPSLTPLAAAELVHVMLGATLVTLAIGGDAGLVLIPLGVELLAAFVAYGRWRVAPHRARRFNRQTLQPAG